MYTIPRLKLILHSRCSISVYGVTKWYKKKNEKTTLEAMTLDLVYLISTYIGNK